MIPENDTPSKASQIEALLTEQDVAAVLSVSIRHVRNLRQRRLLPWVKLGRSVRFTVPAVRAALEKLTVGARQ